MKKNLVSSISSAKHIKNKGSELKIDRASVNNSIVGIEEKQDDSSQLEKTLDMQLAVEEVSDEDKDHHEEDKDSKVPHDSEYYMMLLERKPMWWKTNLLWAFALIKEKKFDEAYRYIKEIQIIDPDYEKGKVHEWIADIYFNNKSEQWEKVQDLYDKAINIYEEDLRNKLDDDIPDEADEIRSALSFIYIKKGKWYEKMKMLNKAIEMYHESLEYDSKNPLAYLRVGWAHVRKNKIVEGYNYLKKGLKYKRDSIEMLIKICEAILMIDDSKSKERQESALKYIDFCLQKQPNNLEALVLLARLKDKQGETDEAFKLFEKVLKIDGKRPQFFYYFGQLLERRKDIKAAISIYKQWLFLDTENFAWAISLATLLANEGDHLKAAKYFKHAVDINPYNVTARFGLGKEIIQNGSDNTTAAIKHFEYVIEKEPDNYKAYWQIAIVHLEKQNFKEWCDVLKKWLSLNKEYVLGLVTMGNLMFETGRPSQSIKYHKRALKYNPRDIQALIGLGNSLYENGEPKSAIEYYKEAIKIDKTLSDVHYNLGNAMYLIEDTDGAIKHYEIAIKLNPQKPESYYNLGNALCVKTDYEKAIEYYKEAIELDRYNAPAFYNLGNAYYMISEYDKAIKTYLSALELNPESAECHFNIASAYNDKGDYKEALKHYKSSLRQDQDNVETMVWIVQVCKILKNYKEAEKYIHEIKELDPNNEISLQS